MPQGWEIISPKYRKILNSAMNIGIQVDNMSYISGLQTDHYSDLSTIA